jgi:hypothetical protein
MNWLSDLFDPPKPVAVEEKRELFLVVTTSQGAAECYLADGFEPHYPDPATLVVRRVGDGRSTEVKRYGPRGWSSVAWKWMSPSTARRFDLNLR